VCNKLGIDLLKLLKDTEKEMQIEKMSGVIKNE